MNRLIPMIFILLMGNLFAQERNTEALRNFNENRLSIQKKSMMVLGGWSVANMATGAILRSQTEGSEKYFHEMNLIWNVFNAGIAAGSL